MQIDGVKSKNIHEKISETNYFTQIRYIKYKSKIFKVKIIAKKKPLDKQKKSEKKVRRKAQKIKVSYCQKQSIFKMTFYSNFNF